MHPVFDPILNKKLSVVGVHSKNKESKGKLKLAFWGNGVVEIDFFKAEKAETNVSTFCLPWLRGKHQESNFLKLVIPIVLVNNIKGAKHIVINPDRLPYYLSLQQSDITALQRDGLIQPEAPVIIHKQKIDYPTLAQIYRQKLESGSFATRADLARSIGVSRAWISSVLNRIDGHSISST